MARVLQHLQLQQHQGIAYLLRIKHVPKGRVGGVGLLERHTKTSFSRKNWLRVQGPGLGVCVCAFFPSVPLGTDGKLNAFRWGCALPVEHVHVDDAGH